MSKKTKQSRAEGDSSPDLTNDADLEKALADLTPEQAEMFVAALELAMKKRRVMLVGNLAAALAILIGMLWALYMYGGHEPGTFIGWVFLVPFAVAGAIMVGAAKIAKRIGTRS